MPKLVDLTVTIGDDTFTYVPSSNESGVAGFSLQNDVLMGNGYFNVGVRKVLPTQKTRKATLTYGDPLVTECSTDCSVTDRGAIHFRLENMVPPASTYAERVLAYDRFVTLLQDESVRLAVVNNEPFFS